MSVNEILGHSGIKTNAWLGLHKSVCINDLSWEIKTPPAGQRSIYVCTVTVHQRSRDDFVDYDLTQKPLIAARSFDESSNEGAIVTVPPARYLERSRRSIVRA